MARIRLTQRRVDGPRPRKSAYDIRDRDLGGFGIGVAPSGAKSWFVHVQRDGRRVWRTIGKAGEIDLRDARARAGAMLAAARRGEDDPPAGGEARLATPMSATAKPKPPPNASEPPSPPCWTEKREGPRPGFNPGPTSGAGAKGRARASSDGAPPRSVAFSQQCDDFAHGGARQALTARVRALV